MGELALSIYSINHSFTRYPAAKVEKNQILEIMIRPTLFALIEELFYPIIVVPTTD